MALWDEELHEASFDGVTFPVAQRTLSGGRAFARRRYTNRNGQAVEDTGREPYSFELTIPLFAGVDPGHYPGQYEALRAAVDHPDTQGEAEYVDPELGPLRAKVVDWRWQTDSGARDGGIFTLRLEEVSHDDLVLSTGRDVQGSAEEFADLLDELVGDVDEAELEAAFGAAGVPLTDDEKDRVDGSLWSTQVEHFVEAAEDGVSSAEDVADRVDALRARIDVLLARDELQEPDRVHAHHAAVGLAAALVALGEEAVARATPLVEHRVASELSVYELSAQLYGTPDRADEILARNPTPSPLFIPAGTTLVVLAA